MKKIFTLVLIAAILSVSALAIEPSATQTEPIYVGASFFAESTCSASSSSLVTTYSSGCDYFCSWCLVSRYQCSSRGSCC